MWVQVQKKSNSHVGCAVCMYLQHLIDITERKNLHVMNALQERLGRHYDMQSCQRLAQSRIEEKCAQSGGEMWFMKIDKMEESAIVLPTEWAEHRSSFFKGSTRIVCALNGSLWHGTQHFDAMVGRVG